MSTARFTTFKDFFVFASDIWFLSMKKESSSVHALSANKERVFYHPIPTEDVAVKYAVWCAYKEYTRKQHAHIEVIVPSEENGKYIMGEIKKLFLKVFHSDFLPFDSIPCQLIEGDNWVRTFSRYTKNIIQKKPVMGSVEITLSVKVGIPTEVGSDGYVDTYLYTFSPSLDLEPEKSKALSSLLRSSDPWEFNVIQLPVIEG